MSRSKYNNNRIYIPTRKQFPQLPKPKGVTKRIVEKKEPLEDTIINNKSIDVKRLSLLINICHVVADVNEQLSVEIGEILQEADPNMQLQFQRSVTQIRNHSADMVRFVDMHTSPEFAEGFGETADALKEVIMNFFYRKDATANG